MAAPWSEDSDDLEGIFQQELELLQEIFIHEIEITKEKGYPYEVSLMLHPATADRTDLQYVTLTIVFRISKGYPDILPDIFIRNPRGLSEEEVISLQKRLSECAAERSGEAMLYELIVIAKESLTANNTPSCPCVICYHNFQEADEFTRTHCYHYFHSNCLSRYISYAQQNEETPLCPVCREELSLVDSPTDSVVSNDVDPPKFTADAELRAWQKKMAALRSKQAKKGGIIDVAANSNKFLLDISSTPSTPVIITVGDSKKNGDQGTGSDLTSDKEKDKQPINKNNDQHRGRAGHQRGVSGHYSGRRGESGGVDGSGGRGGGRGGWRGGGHERGRGRRDGRHPRDGRNPRDGRHGSSGSTSSGEPRGRGGRPSNKTKGETENKGKASETGNTSQRQRGAYGRRHQEEEGDRKDIVKEEGFNLYDNEVGEQRTKTVKVASIDNTRTETRKNGRYRGNRRNDKQELEKLGVSGRELDEKDDNDCGEQKTSEKGGISRPGNNGKGESVINKLGVSDAELDKRDGHGLKEGRKVVEEAYDTADQKNGKRESVTDKLGVSDVELNKRNEDGLKEGREQVEKLEYITDQKKRWEVLVAVGCVSDNQKKIHEVLVAVGCVSDDRKMSNPGKNDSDDRMRIRRTDAKEVIRDKIVASCAEAKSCADTNVDTKMLSGTNSGQQEIPLDREGIKRAQTSTRQDHRWRGLGRRNFSGQERSFTDRKGSSIYQGAKHNMNKGQRLIGEISRVNNRATAQGTDKDQRGDKMLPTKEQCDKGERSPRNRKEQTSFNRWDKATSAIKCDSSGKKNDRVPPSKSKRMPPGFGHIPKSRPPPRLEDFR